MSVRTDVRRGKRRLIIDIAYTNSDGTPARYRRDAAVQTLAAARAEDKRRLGLLALTGSPVAGLNAPAAAPETEPGPIDSAAGARHASASFAEAATLFEQLYMTTRLKPSTRRGYAKVLHSRLVPRFGALTLHRIDATLVRELDRDLVRRGARPSTRANVQAVLRSVLRFAVEQGLAEDLPRPPPLPRVGATVHVALSDDEVQRVIEAAGDRYRLPFDLARHAGLRAGEVRGLRWSDVDLAKGFLVVRRARCHDIEAPPKSGHERLVPLHPGLRASLTAAGAGSPKAYVTGPEPGRPWSESALGHAFRRACAKVGLEGFHLHDLRHFFVTQLFLSGASAPVVQRLAGHAHLVTTQRYSHVTFDDLAEGMRRLAGNQTATGSEDRNSGAEKRGDS